MGMDCSRLLMILRITEMSILETVGFGEGCDLRGSGDEERQMVGRSCLNETSWEVSPLI
jgi:hypothetical protein